MFSYSFLSSRLVVRDSSLYICCCCRCFLHINRSGLYHTYPVYNTWLPIRYVVCWTEKDQRNIYKEAQTRAKEKYKNDKDRRTRIITKYTCQKKIDEGHSIERIWHSASREPSDTLPRPQPCTQTRSIYHTHSILSGFQFSLTAQSTALRGSLGWSNQRGSKTSQACYSHPRCNLNLVRLFRFSLLLQLTGLLFFFRHPHGHKMYCV